MNEDKPVTTAHADYNWVHIDEALRTGFAACVLAFSLGLLFGSLLRRTKTTRPPDPVVEVFKAGDSWKYRRFYVRWPNCDDRPDTIRQLPGIPRPLEQHPHYQSIPVRCVEVTVTRTHLAGEWMVVCTYSRD